MEDLASKIKTLRQKRKMSQEDLAKSAGVSQPLIVKLESGKQAHTTRLAAIARALHVSAADLDPAYTGAPVQEQPPAQAMMGQFDSASFSSALWFANFVQGRSKDEIDQIINVLETAFPR